MTTATPSFDATYETMRQKLARVVPEIELRYKAEIVHRINELKAERSVVILGHNYMEPALFHTVPDYVGDSFELSRIASQCDAETIIFCGVAFMAETAKILAPDKTVLLPSLEAGCSLAASITGEDVRKLREKFPGVPVVSYVNTTADVKAESDSCCTSSNAAKVIESFDSDTVIFLPDEYLARNVARDTGRYIIFPDSDDADATRNRSKRLIIGWRGRCEVHEKFTVADVTNVRKQFPEVTVLAHPECPPDVVQASDFSGSTSAMIKHVRESESPNYLLLTECAMGDNIAAANPRKEMLRLCSVRCPHMNQITLEDTLKSLEDNVYKIDVPEPLARKARRALTRMLEVGATKPID